ncbi:hypothetical protein [Sphingobium sp. WCS2017Hpa-17]|uniref:hypothetical protein n=1 Tax=Sphingobium sp. WCS2017Hpa-17 TaxID=3073638 RepID=UPI00288910F7|nr:hypothetical protein [Sphingobium sp. WCS2017Hpa-17]
MTHVSYLTLTAAALIGMAGTPALAQHQATGRTTAAKVPVKQAAKSQPSKVATHGTKHQAACRSRYKSYDLKSDSYLYRGKKVRCAL